MDLRHFLRSVSGRPRRSAVQEHQIKGAVLQLALLRSAFCSSWKCEMPFLSSATSSPSITASPLTSSSAFATSMQLWLTILPLRLYSVTLPPRVVATMRKQSYLSKIQFCHRMGVRQRGEHGLQALWQCRCPGHYDALL